MTYVLKSKGLDTQQLQPAASANILWLRARHRSNLPNDKAFDSTGIEWAFVCLESNRTGLHSFGIESNKVIFDSIELFDRTGVAVA